MIINGVFQYQEEGRGEGVRGAQPLDTSRTRRPTGKIAALPFPIRDQINEMLLDGVTYQKIADNLATLGHPGFSLQNIGRWQQSGHQQWLAERAKREDAHFYYEAGIDLLKSHKDPAAVLCEANEITMAMQIHRALGQLHACAPESLLTENSKIFFQLSRAVSQQLSQRTHRERLKLHAQKLTITPADLGSLSLGERARVRGKSVPELTEAPTSSKAQSAAEAQALRQSVIDKVEEVFGIKPVDPDSPDAINYGVWPPAPRSPKPLTLDPALTLTPHAPAQATSASEPANASPTQNERVNRQSKIVNPSPVHAISRDFTPNPTSNSQLATHNSPLPPHLPIFDRSGALLDYIPAPAPTRFRHSPILSASTTPLATPFAGSTQRTSATPRLSLAPPS